MALHGIVLGVLAVYRIASLLTSEDGPWDIMVRLRRWAGEGFWGKLLDCFACSSVWAALPIACLVGEGHKERLLLWPALSGGALALHRFLGAYEASRRSPGPVLFSEDPAPAEEHHDVLRQAKGPSLQSDHGGADQTAA